MTPSMLEILNNNIGKTPSYDGQPAKIIHLANTNGMTVTVMDVGATWLSCSVPVKLEQREILLRAEDMQEHMSQKAFLGATIGRFSNRIRSGQFSVSGHQVQVDVNEGRNTLHGGSRGFDKCRWNVDGLSDKEVTLTLVSPDGDQGFPGELRASVRYRITDDNSVEIDYQANVSKDCPVSLTNHAYFNLSGIGRLESCLEHSMQISASFYLPTGKDMLPTGKLKPTLGTAFDFNKRKRIGDHFLKDSDQRIANGLDHAFILDRGKTDGKQTAITLFSPGGDLQMQIKTTKPAVQVYSGNFLKGIKGVNGEYENYSGIALETQYLPDGPNHPEWLGVSSVLSAEEQYSHRTRYSFISS